MKENIIQIKTFNFALKIVEIYKFLKNDFVSKLAIAYKEARETAYWIKLLHSSDYISTEQSISLLSDIDEILRIIGKIQITIKNNS